MSKRLNISRIIGFAAVSLFGASSIGGELATLRRNGVTDLSTLLVAVQTPYLDNDDMDALVSICPEEHRWSLSAEFSVGRITPLHAAVICSSLATVKALLENGADVFESNGRGEPIWQTSWRLRCDEIAWAVWNHAMGQACYGIR